MIELDPAHEAVAFRVLPRQVAARTFGHLPRAAQRELVDVLGDADLVEILDEMAPDERTALLEELPASVTRELLALECCESPDLTNSITIRCSWTSGR